MKVLLATDGSNMADEAAWLLAHLPHIDKLELTIMSVCYMNEVQGTLAGVNWLKECVDNEKSKAWMNCEKAAKMFEGANVSIRTIVRDGHVGRAIVTEAVEREVDLIVIGSLGHTALERMLIGSVSDFVATHTPCSVLIVRKTGLRERTHKRLKLCLGYDGSEAYRFAVSQLREFRWLENTELDVVNVVAIPVAFSEIPVLFDVADIKTPMLEKVQAAANELGDLTSHRHGHVVDGTHVGSGLVDFAEQLQSDLIVIGDSGKGLLDRFFRGNASLGSVANFVLRNSLCSVWIARQRFHDGGK